MDHPVFIVCGYGVPKNIFEDPNYNAYLRPVFNTIYESTLSNLHPLIIACGGPTASEKPYDRTEGEEIITFLKNLEQRDFLKKRTRSWQFLPEKASLSTLENLLFTRKILQKKKITRAQLIIFCEQTRKRRISIVARKIFPKSFRIKIHSIDFDISPNRYLDSAFIRTKERTELKHSLWALQNPKNLQEHHRIFEEKFKLLRSVPPEKRQEAIRKWWMEKLEEAAPKSL